METEFDKAKGHLTPECQHDQELPFHLLYADEIAEQDLQPVPDRAA